MSKYVPFAELPVGRSFLFQGRVYRKTGSRSAKTRWEGSEYFSSYDLCRVLRGVR